MDDYIIVVILGLMLRYLLHILSNYFVLIIDPSFLNRKQSKKYLSMRNIILNPSSDRLDQILLSATGVQYSSSDKIHGSS